MITLIKATIAVLVLVYGASIAAIALAVGDLYDHQAATDYRLCQITRLQQFDLIHLAEEAGVSVHAKPLPPCRMR